jgi:hypothetical protein
MCGACTLKGRRFFFIGCGQNRVLTKPVSPRRLFYVWILSLQLGAEAQEIPVVLRTPIEGALTSFAVKLDLSPVRPQILSFDFGFSTVEAASLSGFLDSFSITLQTTNGNATALLATIDRSGLQLAPPNPGGLVLGAKAVRAFGADWVPVSGSFDYHLSYHLTFTIPAASAGANNLYFDLFSNENGQGSLGYFANIKVTPPPFVVESASVFNGQYTEEPEVVLDFVAGTASVPLIRSAQFFRVKAAVAVKVTLSSLTTNQFVFDFEPQGAGSLGTVVLQSSQLAAGPFVDSADAVVDLAGRKIRAPRIPSVQSFRFNGDVAYTIKRIERRANSWLMHFE